MRIYRWLLYLFPASFRNEYGQEMYTLFATRLRAESWGGQLLLWLEAVADIVLSAAGAQMDELRQDLRYAVRTLGRAPGFACTAMAITAIGVGATTTAFSVTDHVLLRPLPFLEADRLVQLWEDQSPSSYSEVEPSPPNYRDWKGMSHSFSTMAAYHSLSASLQAGGEGPQLIEGAVFSANLMPMLGARPELGRTFAASDDQEAAPATVVLSDQLWHRRFGADPSILGRKLLLDGEPFTVIGVMPKDFLFPRREVLLWTALRFRPEDWADRTNNWLRVIAKLRPGVTLAQASQEMRVIGARLKRAYPRENAHVSVTTESLTDSLRQGRQRNLLLTLLGAAVCVLGVACLNLANLLMARSLSRRKEIAVRTALGAGRDRLVRQMLTESAVVAGLGGLGGIVLAFALAPLLQSLVPDSLPIAAIPPIDARVLLFSVALMVVTAVGFGAFPALQACSQMDVTGLHEGARGGVGGRREGMRRALVVFEVAASITLLIAAGLLLQALSHLREIDPGFQTAGVLTARTSLPMPKYEQTSRRNAFYNEVLSSVRALPGVESAGYTSFLPLVVRGGIWPVRIPGQPEQASGITQATLRYVTPGYFSALRIPITGGRNLTEQDAPGAPLAAVVSRSFGERYWPGQNPLGKQFQFNDGLRTIVGIAGDVRVRGLERGSEPQVYLPYRQQPDGNFVWYAPKDLAIRSAGDFRRIIPSLRRIIRQADPEQPLSDIQPMEDILQAETLPRLIQVRMVGTFAAIAFVLAAIGIHGLLSFTVSSRRQEIGVRMALGARPGRILKTVLGEVGGLAMLGIALGMGCGYGAGWAMRSILAGVEPGDWATYGAAAGCASVMVSAASLLPAIRALRIDPTIAMRGD